MSALSAFFFNHPATTEIYTLSLHDALPISRAPAGERRADPHPGRCARSGRAEVAGIRRGEVDRKSTRLNSSHTVISYAVFCLKKKKRTTKSRNLAHWTLRDSTRPACSDMKT